jgi:hypothetical protein
MAHAIDREESDRALFQEISDFLAETKSLTLPIKWVTDGTRLIFSATLDIAEVTDERVTMRGNAVTHMPDRNVALVLTWQGPYGRPQAFERFDWKPLHLHANNANVPKPHRHRRFLASHHHPLSLNSRVSNGLSRAMGDNLPAALPMEPDPSDWAAFTAALSAAWRIPNLIHAPPPPWQYDLLAGLNNGRKGGHDI